MKVPTSLAGRVALVTGGTRGIGLAAALALGRAGASVVVTGRSRDRARDGLESLRREGVSAHFAPADVRDRRSGHVAVDAALATFGRLDIAFNNAGIAVTRPFLDQGEEDWQETLDTNLTGVWRSMQAEIAAMLDQGRGGSIVNNASIWGVRGRVGLADYCAAKHGVIGLTRTAALEFGSAGIRVNAVCPGTADTDLVRAIRAPDELAALGASYPLGRLVTPAEVADAVVWLAGDASSFITGQRVMIDGGYTAR